MADSSTPSGSRPTASRRDWAPHVRPRVSSLRLSPTREHEIVDELSQHLEDRWRELVAGGASEDEATRLALAEFREGNLLARYMAPLQQAQTPAPTMPGVETGHMFSDIWMDLRYTTRVLRKQLAFTVAAVLTLALGIGATTAIFSVVEGVLLRPLPYPDEGRIVRVGATNRASSENAMPFSPRGYWHFVNNNRSFQKLGGFLQQAIVPYPLTGDGAPLQISTALMTGSAFEVLGVFPERGRLPTPEESAPRGPSVVLLSHDLWASRFGADPSIVGKLIDLNGTRREVIGIMPASYDFPTPEVDAWIPFQLDPASELFSAHFIGVIARLKPGVTIDAATEDARGLIARFGELGYAASWFKDIFDGGAIVRPLRDEIVRDARQPLLIVFGTVGFILLIACSNVANLLLVRAEGRRQENAVRVALGSGRARLVRQMLVESAVLALVGGATGVLFAYGGVRALVAVAPAGIPRLDEIGINGTALAFTAVVSVLAGLLFGVLPALRASSTRVMAALRDGGRSAASGGARHRTRNALVMTQVALAFVLVVGSGLLVRSFHALRSVDPGFSADAVLTFEVRPLPTKYPEAEAMAQFYDRLIERLDAVAGVTRAAAIDLLPLTGTANNVGALIEDFPAAEGAFPPVFEVRRVTPGYFDAMRIPVVEGRAFTADDHTRRLPSVIISSSVKARYWPVTSALGKRIDIARLSARVVGVVGDVHHNSLDEPPGEFMYLPMVDAAGGDVDAMTMTVRTASEPLSLVSAIRDAIAEVDKDLPMGNVQPMERVLGDSMSRTSFTMSVLVIAALIALFLGAVGIYAVLSYVVSLRTPEIGTRLALGASPGAVLRMILSQGMRLAGLGALMGLVAALALSRVIVALLYGVSPVDPVTLVATSAVFLAVAVLASLLPAARAAGTAPVDALRAR
jgi:putative ABC transport system permease protein